MDVEFKKQLFLSAVQGAIASGSLPEVAIDIAIRAVNNLSVKEQAVNDLFR